MSTTALWLSGPRFTIRVAVDQRRIILEAAPIARKFIGQPLGNLIRWGQVDHVAALLGRGRSVRVPLSTLTSSLH